MTIDTIPRTPPVSTLELSRLIGRRRGELGLTKSDLARLINRTHSFVSQLESGTAKLTAHETIRSLAHALQVTPDEVYAAAGVIPEDLEMMLVTLTAEEIGEVRQFVRKITGETL